MLGVEKTSASLPKSNSAKALPKNSFDSLPGSVISEFKKCGKPNCKCQRGDLHGPYYYRFYRVEGKLRREYVRKERLRAVQSQIQEFRTFNQSIKAGNALRKRAMKLLKEYERLWKP
jgi:hypothetical protein